MLKGENLRCARPAHCREDFFEVGFLRVVSMAGWVETVVSMGGLTIFRVGNSHGTRFLECVGTLSNAQIGHEPFREYRIEKRDSCRRLRQVRPARARLHQRGRLDEDLRVPEESARGRTQRHPEACVLKNDIQESLEWRLARVGVETGLSRVFWKKPQVTARALKGARATDRSWPTRGLEKPLETLELRGREGHGN